jgi:uncharacterized membrane protein
MVLVVAAAARVGAAAGQYSKLSTVDLVQIQVNAPAKITAGKRFIVSDTVENQGETQAPMTVTGFCLATDDTCDPTDLKIAARRVPALNPGASQSRESPLTIPASVAPGTYYLVVTANANNDVEERHRGNNVRAVKIIVEAK